MKRILIPLFFITAIFCYCGGAITAENAAFVYASEQPPAMPQRYPKEYYERYSRQNPLFDILHVEVQPVPVVQAVPVLSPELMALGKKATLRFEYVINQAGATENIFLVTASDARFAPAVYAAIKSWKFKPALKGGKPVNCRCQQETRVN